MTDKTETDATETEVEAPKFADPAPRAIKVNKTCTCCG